MATVSLDASQYLRRKLLDHSLGTTEFTMPTDVYVSLYVGDPFGEGTEVSHASHEAYERQLVTFEAADTDGAAVSSATVEWAEAADDWGTVTYCGIHDAATEGNLLYRGLLSPSQHIVASSQMSIPAGDLVISFPASVTTE